LSGGPKQRILLERVSYKQPKNLFIDEVIACAPDGESPRKRNE
jgi:ABC-type uncharacterized transport system fused permease/ATPase subunit